MQNSMGGVHFICLRLKIAILDKFDSKSQKSQHKLEFCTKFDSNIQNLMVMLTFSAFDNKYHSWANLVQKLKIVRSEI